MFVLGTIKIGFAYVITFLGMSFFLCLSYAIRTQVKN